MYLIVDLNIDVFDFQGASRTLGGSWRCCSLPDWCQRKWLELSPVEIIKTDNQFVQERGDVDINWAKHYWNWHKGWTALDRSWTQTGKKAQCKSLKSVLCVCNTLVRLYDFVYLLPVTCLCLYVLSWDKGFCNKHFVYGQGFVQVSDKIL